MPTLHCAAGRMPLCRRLHAPPPPPKLCFTATHPPRAALHPDLLPPALHTAAREPPTVRRRPQPLAAPPHLLHTPCTSIFLLISTRAGNQAHRASPALCSSALKVFDRLSLRQFVSILSVLPRLICQGMNLTSSTCVVSLFHFSYTLFHIYHLPCTNHTLAQHFRISFSVMVRRISTRLRVLDSYHSCYASMSDGW